jgi:hypothetical protein
MDQLMSELRKAGVKVDRATVQERIDDLSFTDADLTPDVIKDLVAEFQGSAKQTIEAKAIATTKRGKASKSESQQKAKQSSRSPEQTATALLVGHDGFRSAQEQQAIGVMVDRDNQVVPNILTGYSAAIEGGALDDYSEFFREWFADPTAAIASPAEQSFFSSNAAIAGD